MNKTIYDFGMNNGDDVEYYLKKGMKVVGIDANAALCADATKRFVNQIRSGALVILNVAISDSDNAAPSPFYIHNQNHVLSQFSEPASDQRENFTCVMVQQRSAAAIIAEYGHPYYVKIDLEGYDCIVLDDISRAGISPDFISAEAHGPDVFAALLRMGYTAFNLVDGPTVSQQYRAAEISTPRGAERFSFNDDSAGPFGDDIASQWMGKSDFFYFLAMSGLGWKDIHATNQIAPAASAPELLHRKTRLREHITDFIPSALRAVRRRLPANWIS